jgi:hypothetical protein
MKSQVSQPDGSAAANAVAMVGPDQGGSADAEDGGEQDLEETPTVSARAKPLAAAAEGEATMAGLGSQGMYRMLRPSFIDVVEAAGTTKLAAPGSARRLVTGIRIRR